MIGFTDWEGWPVQVLTTLLEVVGVLAVVAAAVLVDWRLGVAVAGAALILASWAMTRLQPQGRPRRRQ